MESRGSRSAHHQKSHALHCSVMVEQLTALHLGKKRWGQLLQEMQPMLFLRLGSKKLEQLAPSPDQKSHAQCTLCSQTTSLMWHPGRLFFYTSSSTFPHGQNLTTVKHTFRPKVSPTVPCESSFCTKLSRVYSTITTLQCDDGRILH